MMAGETTHLFVWENMKREYSLGIGFDLLLLSIVEFRRSVL